jgi:hypothetical protein
LRPGAPQCSFGAPQQSRALFWVAALFAGRVRFANIRNEISALKKFRAVGIALA